LKKKGSKKYQNLKYKNFLLWLHSFCAGLTFRVNRRKVFKPHFFFELEEIILVKYKVINNLSGFVFASKLHPFRTITLPTEKGVPVKSGTLSSAVRWFLRYRILYLLSFYFRAVGSDELSLSLGDLWDFSFFFFVLLIFLPWLTLHLSLRRLVNFAL